MIFLDCGTPIYAFTYSISCKVLCTNVRASHDVRLIIVVIVHMNCSKGVLHTRDYQLAERLN